jgi:hypothetical protein
MTFWILISKVSREREREFFYKIFAFMFPQGYESHSCRLKECNCYSPVLIISLSKIFCGVDIEFSLVCFGAFSCPDDLTDKFHAIFCVLLKHGLWHEDIYILPMNL